MRAVLENNTESNRKTFETAANLLEHLYWQQYRKSWSALDFVKRGINVSSITLGGVSAIAGGIGIGCFFASFTAPALAPIFAAISMYAGLVGIFAFALVIGLAIFSCILPESKKTSTTPHNNQLSTLRDKHALFKSAAENELHDHHALGDAHNDHKVYDPEVSEGDSLGHSS